MMNLNFLLLQIWGIHNSNHRSDHCQWTFSLTSYRWSALQFPQWPPRGERPQRGHAFGRVWTALSSWFPSNLGLNMTKAKQNPVTIVIYIFGYKSFLSQKFYIASSQIKEVPLHIVNTNQLCSYHILPPPQSFNSYKEKRWDIHHR